MPDQAFRQVDEKHVSVEVEHMLWSPKIDLVALSNVQGETVLHRLSWQRVWTLAAPSEDHKVTALTWRPDGKVLAVGYNTGKIILCDIENSDILHTLTVTGEITCMSWVSQKLPDGTVWTDDPYPEDNSEVYLPKLQPLTKSYGTLAKGRPVEENVEDSKKLKDQKTLNLLVVGSTNKELHLFAYGIYPAGVVPLGHCSGYQLKRICSAVLSQDLHSLAVLVACHGEQATQQHHFLMTFDTTLLASRHKELRLIALKYGQISTLIGYLQSTIQQMSEAWEDILMEMDSKLLKFAEEKKKTGQGTVTNDFLELLMFGTPSSELKVFLLHELTEKGLKKLGHSIETSYSNIQKLVVKHLQNVAQAIVYHLTDLRGMSLWFDKFGVLGLDVHDLQETLSAAGSFVLKTSELQQVIDGSIKNFKAFFRWLYVEILRLSDEKPPPALSKTTQHDINFVSEFLTDNFTHFAVDSDEDSISALRTEKKPGFKLEKVGQYLKKEDLHYPPDISGNPWIQFLRANTHLTDSPVLYPVQNNKSLLQLQEQLENSINSSLTRPAAVIGRSFQCMSAVRLFSTASESVTNISLRVAQFTCNESHQLYTIFSTGDDLCEKFYIVRQPTDAEKVPAETEGVCVKVGTLVQSDINASDSADADERCEEHRVLDLASYDDRILSLLLTEKTEDQTPVLVQLSLSVISSQSYIPIPPNQCLTDLTDVLSVDVGSHIGSQSYRRLENMKAHSFAVSGTRKTATVLFSSRRRVRVFLMDAEEEEDDDDDDEEDGDTADHEGGITDQSQLEEGDSSAILEEGDSIAILEEGNTSSVLEEGMHVEESMEEQEDKENTSFSSQEPST